MSLSGFEITSGMHAMEKETEATRKMMGLMLSEVLCSIAFIYSNWLFISCIQTWPSVDVCTLVIVIEKEYIRGRIGVSQLTCI